MTDHFIQWSPGMTLESIEKAVILKAFAFYRYNKTATASALKIAIRTLDAKLEKYRYEEEQERERQASVVRNRRDFLERQRGNVPDNLGITHPSIYQRPPEVNHVRNDINENPPMGPKKDRKK